VNFLRIGVNQISTSLFSHTPRTEGWIAGAALDAFTREPLPASSPLRAVDPDRLILTPHNVSHSEAGRRANLTLALDQILAAGRSEPPAHCVNPETIPRWRTS